MVVQGSIDGFDVPMRGITHVGQERYSCVAAERDRGQRAKE